MERTKKSGVFEDEKNKYYPSVYAERTYIYLRTCYVFGLEVGLFVCVDVCLRMCVYACYKMACYLFTLYYELQCYNERLTMVRAR